MPLGLNGIKKGRPRAFIERDDGVWCEDISIAASLLCYGEMQINNVSKKDYKPGVFFGTVLAKDKNTEEPIFLFHIRGDTKDLWERKRLWYRGAYRINPREFTSAREYLMTALRGAMEDAKTGKKIIPMKETIFDAKIQGEGVVLSSGSSPDEGRDVGVESEQQPHGEGDQGKEAGTDTRETEGSEEVAVGGDE